MEHLKFRHATVANIQIDSTENVVTVKYVYKQADTKGHRTTSIYTLQAHACQGLNMYNYINIAKILGIRLIRFWVHSITVNAVKYNGEQ